MQLGFYENRTLLNVQEVDGLTSDILLPTLESIIRKYRVEKIIYTSGPGSHMATKITYVILKTINILINIEFNAISAFDLNNSKPIKALGKLYFIKEKKNIITKRFETDIDCSFKMPKNLEELTILEAKEPDYHISAIN